MRVSPVTRFDNQEEVGSSSQQVGYTTQKPQQIESAGTGEALDDYKRAHARPDQPAPFARQLAWYTTWHRARKIEEKQSSIIAMQAMSDPVVLPFHHKQTSRMVIRCPVLGDGLGDAATAHQFSIEMAYANPQNRIDLVIIAGLNFNVVKQIFDTDHIPSNVKIHFIQTEYDQYTMDPIVPKGPSDALRAELLQEENPIVLIDIPIPNPNYGYGSDYEPTSRDFKEDLDGWLVSHPGLYFRISEHGSHFSHVHNSKTGAKDGVPELFCLGISSGRDDPSFGMLFPKMEARDVNDLSCKNHPFIRALFGDTLDMAAYHKNHVLTTIYSHSDFFPINIVALQCALAKDTIDTVDALIMGAEKDIGPKLAAARNDPLWREMGVKHLISVEGNGVSTCLGCPNPGGIKTVRLFMAGLKNQDVAIIQGIAMQGLEKNQAVGVGGACGDGSLIELMGLILKQAQDNSPAQLFPAIDIKLIEHFNNWMGLMQAANRMGNFILLNVLYFLGGYGKPMEAVYPADQIKSVACKMQLPEVIKDFRRLVANLHTRQNPLRISWDIDKALIKFKGDTVKHYV